MDTEQIEYLKSDDRLKIKSLYDMYRDSFMNFGRTYGAGQDLLSDVYQEAFLALRKRAIQGKLDHVKGDLKSYLYGIGKFMLIDELKKESRTVRMDHPLRIVEEDVEEITVETSAELTEEQKLLYQFFQKLGKKCQRVLTLFYYRGLTIEEIVAQTAYGNANTVKAQKSRCLRSLKQMIQK